MRGIEAALLVWRDVQGGIFASEAIRKRGSALPESERVLASTLVFVSLRRALLWKHIARNLTGRPLGTLSPAAGDALVMGIAGVTEIRHFAPRVLVNAMVEWVKNKGNQRESGMVNAVLRRAVDEGPDTLKKLSGSRSLKDNALAGGVPSWAAAMWSESWGKDRARDLVRFSSMKSMMSLRLSPRADIESTITRISDAGYRSWRSPLLEDSLRLSSSAHPPALPGYDEGLFSPQSESSMIIGKVVSSLYSGGILLDMCSGRGVKALQVLDTLSASFLECWDLSAAKIRAASAEALRLGIPSNRFIAKSGDALFLDPSGEVRTVFLDAPCSGSGTWSRHPEGKMRLIPDRIGDMYSLQCALLSKALDIIPPGGSVIYSTCSLFRQENEQVVAKVMESREDIVEMPPDNTYHSFSRGRPWGNYIFPTLPWLDGFYLAVLNKRV
ncbi:MAG TPA: hypothetical protein ENN89_02020 [Synergistetes bacterium]|nr:hypothetical protein [Synergistota bacterium]